MSERADRHLDPGSPAPHPPASPPGGGSGLRRWLEGGGPAEVLARIATEDPLRLYELGARRIRQRAWLLDPDRLFSRSLVQVALLAREAPCDEADPRSWLLDRVDEAIEYLLRRDAAQEELSACPQAYAFLERMFLLDPEQARRAAAGFNALPEPHRQAFFALLIEERDLSSCVARLGGSAETLQARLVTAVERIFGGPLRGSTAPGGTRVS